MGSSDSREPKPAAHDADKSKATAPVQPMPRSSRGRRLFDSRTFRLSMGAALIALSAVLVVPRVISYTAVDAIVQGRTATLSTPIEGMVGEMSAREGASVHPGAPLAVVTNPRLDRSFLNELITERDSLLQRIDALDDQAAGLTALKADLDARSAQLKAAAARTLARERAMGEAAVRAVRADLNAAQLARARNDRLAADRLVPESAAEAARARVAVLQAEVERLQAELALLAEESRQAAAGIFIADGRYGAPYAEIRGDEIAITLLDIDARKREQRTRVIQIDRQVAAERARLAKAGRATIASPHAGVVWRVFAAPGSDVVIGQEIAQVLDCASTFLEILVTEGRFNATRVGETVSYRLVGEDTFRTATVTALRGAKAVAEDRSLAANLTADRDSTFRVYAAPRNRPNAGETADAGSQRYCNVGRHAQVRFPKALPDRLRNPLALLQGLFE